MVVGHPRKTSEKDVNKTNKLLMRELENAARTGSLEKLKKMLALELAKEDVRVNLNCALRKAISLRCLPLVKYLSTLKNIGGQLICTHATQDPHELFYAAEIGDLEIVRYLSTLRNSEGQLIYEPTLALQRAALQGCLKVV